MLDSLITKMFCHTSFVGKTWYLVTLIFRLLVVATVGRGMYANEASSFRCHNFIPMKDEHYHNFCYEIYATHKPLVMWTFQILMSLVPAFFFLIYLHDMDNRIVKMEIFERQLKNLITTQTTTQSRIHNTVRTAVRDGKNLLKQLRNKTGDYEKKLVLSGGIPVEVSFSRKLNLANLLHVIALSIEVTTTVYICHSLYLHYSYQMYEIAGNKVMDGSELHNAIGSMFSTSVPSQFSCIGDPDVKWSYDPPLIKCQVPLSINKTVFLKYMSVMALVAALLSLGEITMLVCKIRRNMRKGEVDDTNENDENACNCPNEQSIE